MVVCGWQRKRKWQHFNISDFSATLNMTVAYPEMMRRVLTSLAAGLAAVGFRIMISSLLLVVVP